MLSVITVAGIRCWSHNFTFLLSSTKMMTNLPSIICLNPCEGSIMCYLSLWSFKFCYSFLLYITPLGGCKVPGRTVISCFTGLHWRYKILRCTTYRVYTWSIAEMKRDIIGSQISEPETWKQLSTSNQYKWMNLSKYATKCFYEKTVKFLLWLIWCDTH